MEDQTAIQADRQRTRLVPATACSAGLRERIRHQSEDIPTDTPQPLVRKPSDQTPRCHLEPEQTPTEGQETSNRTKRASPSQPLHRACSGPPVTLSSAHLTSEQVAKWVQHQRTQLEAGTFDARTLTTTISKRSWTMIGFKIVSSRTLRKNPASDWRKDWKMDAFLKALEEVYTVEPKDRFMETGSIWQAICLATLVET